MTAVEFPISIGVVGAPGAGKLLLGVKFAEIAGDWFDENDSYLEVIENAGRTIEQDFDQAMGNFGTYSDDLRAYFRRQEAEELALAKGVSYLSLGTALDHIAHCGTNYETVATGLATPDQDAKSQQYQLTMTMLTLLFREQFRYTFGFYLPHPGVSVILPGEPDTENEYNQRIDRALTMVMSSFGLRIQVLDQGTIEDKAEIMFDTVKRIVENGPEESEETPSEEDVSSLEDAALPE